MTRSTLPIYPGINIGAFGIEATLRRRGFLVVARGDYKQTIAPDSMQPSKMLSSGACLPDWDNDYYNLMGKISFRKMLRFMLARPNGVSGKELCDGLDQAHSKIHERLMYLSKSRLVEKHGRNQWRQVRAPNNFGPTFERYVKSVFEREFICAAEWGIKLGDFENGDFDVLALTDSVLCYVECKIARPEDLSTEELKHFLQRSQDLAPEIAILLIDTEDSLESPLERLENILISITRKQEQKENWKPSEPFFREPSGFAGIYFGRRRIFIINAKTSVVHNLRLCLRFYSTWVKFQSFWGGPRFNYITGEVLPL